MTLVKWNPNRRLFNLRNNWQDDFFGSDVLMNRSRETWYPAVDIEENDNDYVVSLELPGMQKDDIKISYHGDILNISGEKRTESEEEKGNYHHFERRFGKFERSFRINSDIIGDKIDANMKDGILIIKLPKAEISKPKQIEVKVK